MKAAKRLIVSGWMIPVRRILTPSAMPGGARLTVRRLFAVEFASDTGLLADVPETVALYFDYEAYARDLFWTPSPLLTVMCSVGDLLPRSGGGYGLPGPPENPGRLTPA